MTWYVPRTLISKSLHQVAELDSAMGAPGAKTPALLIRVWAVPNLSLMASKVRATAASSAISVGSVRISTEGNSAWIIFLVSSADDSDKVMRTSPFTPDWAWLRAMAYNRTLLEYESIILL